LTHPCACGFRRVRSPVVDADQGRREITTGALGVINFMVGGDEELPLPQ